MTNINFIHNYLLVNQLNKKIAEIDKYPIDIFLKDKYKYKYNILLGITVTLSIVFLLLINKYILNNTQHTSIQTGGIGLGVDFEYYRNINIGDIVFKPGIYLRIFLYSFLGFVIIGWIASRKLSMHCYGCSKGSWWYKCLPDSGENSTQCEIEKTNTKILKDFTTILTTFRSTLQDVHSKLLNILTDIKNSFTYLPNKMKYIINEATKIPELKLPSINLSCSMEIPIIKVDLNPCSPFNTIMNGIITGINSSAGFLQKLIVQITKFIKKLLYLILSLFKRLIQQFLTILKYFMIPLEKLANILLQIKNLIYDIIELINIKGIINMILYYIVNTIRNATGLNIGTIFVICSMSFLLFFIGPFIGGLIYGWHVTLLFLNLLTKPLELLFEPFNIISNLFELFN
tara:strand:+ start:664 stop:1866 length:1203 start_codon:yes stop_codon:yes gene_type:complete